MESDVAAQFQRTEVQEEDSDKFAGRATKIYGAQNPVRQDRVSKHVLRLAPGAVRPMNGRPAALRLDCPLIAVCQGSAKGYRDANVVVGLYFSPLFIASKHCATECAGVGIPDTASRCASVLAG
jgi:hypothetical protein